MTTPAPAPAPIALSIADVARLLDVHHTTIRRGIRSGAIRVVRVGRVVRVPRVELDRLTNPAPTR
ncbi:MAG: helix-turn-helix domain-containing protein [Deltaproteobacteria bacterium]